MTEPKKEPVLPAFQSFLLSHGLAPKKNIPFYAYWASRFLAFCNMRDMTDLSAACPEFEQSLLADRTIADWQVKQAEDAVRIYLTNFKRNMKPKHHEAGEETQFGADRLVEETKRLLRVKHYSYSTERTYIDWITRFFQYMRETIGMRPGQPGPEDVRNYLTHLAIRKRVSSSTQNQAFNALLFLFRDVLKVEMGDISGTVRAKRGQKLPVVLSVEEIKSVFEHMSGTALLIAHILYGAGLRLMELARLRVKDVDFDMNVITVRSGKGDKDRTTVLPASVKDRLRAHIAKVKSLHEKDLSEGHGEVYLPDALARKYPNAGKVLGWQYVFPSAKLSIDPRSGRVRRHHISDKAIQSAIANAVEKAGIVKHATVHTLRHSFATHLLMTGVNIREIQDLLGHKSVETTMIYTHVLRDMKNVPQSPLDVLYGENGR
jgi:integron integrase